MPVSRLEHLFNCYVQHNCSKAEEEELMALLAQSKNEAEVKKLLDKVIENTELEMSMPDQKAAFILQHIFQKDEAAAASFKSKRVVFLSWTRVAAAAIILILSGAAYWLLIKENKDKTTSSIALFPAAPLPVLPGGNHAILTMADGSIMVLDSVQNGNMQHGSAKINKQDALLIYNGSLSLNTDAPVVCHTLTTPRGGEYQLVLPDGSKVWLNASSSLRFPTTFTGKQRKVELTGEAYFEVAPLFFKGRKVPFEVKINTTSGDGGEVEVLGTHFNINAYNDEPDIKTTLIEGAVKVKRGNAVQTLVPGQQALSTTDNIILDKKADVSQFIAWKEGFIWFNNTDIHTIMRQVARWYDVTVEFEGKITEDGFSGKIARNMPLSSLLKVLALSGVRFKTEGRKITVIE